MQTILVKEKENLDEVQLAGHSQVEAFATRKNGRDNIANAKSSSRQEANLDYHGTITLDPDHREEAGILPMEFVEIWNKNSGARITIYVIRGEWGSRWCILNGAARARAKPATRSSSATQST